MYFAYLSNVFLFKEIHFLHSFIHSFTVAFAQLCVPQHKCESQNLQRSVLSFQHVGPPQSNQVVRLGNQCLHLVEPLPQLSIVLHGKYITQ